MRRDGGAAAYAPAMSASPLPELPLSDGVVALRAFHADDAPVAVAWCADPDIVQWSGAPADPTEEAALEWAALTDIAHARGVLALAVIDAVSGHVLGSVDIRRPFDWDP